MKARSLITICFLVVGLIAAVNSTALADDGDIFDLDWTMPEHYFTDDVDLSDNVENWYEMCDPLAGEPLDSGFVVIPEPAIIVLLCSGGLLLLLRR